MFKKILVLASVVLLTHCSSTAKRTQFYTLHTNVLQKASEAPQLQHLANANIGIGPVDIPGEIKRQQVMSYGKGQAVLIQSHAFWAEDLTSLITRVITDDLSTLLGADNVWAFPWGIDARPELQIPITIVELGGSLGGEVRLVAKWKRTGLAHTSNAEVHSIRLSEMTQDSSIESYTSTLNVLVSRLAEAIAKSL